MSEIIPVIILILVMLIQALMRLSPNIFAILQHSAIAKKSTRKTTKRFDSLSASFVLGTETITVLTLLIVFLVVSLFTSCRTFMDKSFFYVMSGILAFEAIAIFFFYFKRKSTRLFINRHTASALTKKCETAKRRRDTFLLGLVTRTMELPFTLPLFILAAYEAAIIKALPCFSVAIIYLVVSVLPFFIIYTFFQTGHTIADFARLNEKTRLITRLILTALYIALAILIVNHGVVI